MVGKSHQAGPRPLGISKSLPSVLSIAERTETIPERIQFVEKEGQRLTYTDSTTTTDKESPHPILPATIPTSHRSCFMHMTG